MIVELLLRSGEIVMVEASSARAIRDEMDTVAAAVPRSGWMQVTEIRGWWPPENNDAQTRVRDLRVAAIDSVVPHDWQDAYR